MCKAVMFVASLCVLTSCGPVTTEKRTEHSHRSDVVVRDEVFRSAALGREMKYRVILPKDSDRKLAAGYLLHGAEGDLRDWYDNSEVSSEAAKGLMLVMPQGDNAYYVNAVGRTGDRYEDYIVRDLIGDVERKYPTLPERAIVGVSMGGFGAVTLGLKHPELFRFIGALSPAIDVTQRGFSVKRISQWWNFRELFGPAGSQERKDRDPFAIARGVDVKQAPYMFLTCGDGESLLPPNRQFADLLTSRGIASEFHVVKGGHDWANWGAQVPTMFATLLKNVRVAQ